MCPPPLPTPIETSGADDTHRNVAGLLLVKVSEWPAGVETALQRLCQMSPDAKSFGFLMKDQAIAAGHVLSRFCFGYWKICRARFRRFPAELGPEAHPPNHFNSGSGGRKTPESTQERAL